MMNGRGNSRRGPGSLAPPPSAAVAPQLSHAQMQEHHRQEQVRRGQLIRTSRKPTDRRIPDELAGVTVGDGVHRYEQLRDAERRLDALMMRKRLDVKDNAQRAYSRREGILRVWISNTAEGQPWQLIEEESGINADGMLDFGDDNKATYRMKIEGRLLDGADEQEGDEEGGDGEAKTATPRPKFSSFFRSITVDFDRNPNLQPDGYSQIGWRKQQQSPQNPNVDLTSKENNFDMLEFERKSDENINVTVNLVRDQKNERFKLSPALVHILDTDEEDMPGIVQGIWEYARARKLQEDEDKRTITCDDALRRVFNQDKISFQYLPNELQPHLQTLPPIKLAYTIRVDKAYISPPDSSTTMACQPTIYDVRVPLPTAFTPVLKKFHNSPTHMNSLQSLIKMDEDLALLVAKINQTNAKRKFFDNLAKDPGGFVQRWVGSQKRDLDVILAEATRGGGEDGEQWRKGGQTGVWGSDVARESVGLWLARSGKH